MAQSLTCTCVVAGGGPAGMMAGYLLARAGVDCDVYTRAYAPDLPDVVAVEPGFNVHHVDAGPRRPLAKDALPGLLTEFGDGVSARMRAGAEADAAVRVVAERLGPRCAAAAEPCLGHAVDDPSGAGADLEVAAHHQRAVFLREIERMPPKFSPTAGRPMRRRRSR